VDTAIRQLLQLRLDDIPERRRQRLLSLGGEGGGGGATASSTSSGARRRPSIISSDPPSPSSPSIAPYETLPPTAIVPTPPSPTSSSASPPPRRERSAANGGARGRRPRLRWWALALGVGGTVAAVTTMPLLVAVVLPGLTLNAPAHAREEERSATRRSERDALMIVLSVLVRAGGAGGLRAFSSFTLF